MAESARVLLWLTGWQIGLGVLGTGLLLVTLIFSAKQTRAATRANELSRQALIADRRPWLAVNVTMAGPITWTVNGADFGFLFFVENVGRSPALHIHMNIKMMIEFGDMKFDKEQIAFADEIRSRSPGVIGTTVFPNQKVTQEYGIPVD